MLISLFLESRIIEDSVFVCMSYYWKENWKMAGWIIINIFIRYIVEDNFILISQWNESFVVIIILYYRNVW